jgi:hypothetical protein
VTPERQAALLAIKEAAERLERATRETAEAERDLAQALADYRQAIGGHLGPSAAGDNLDDFDGCRAAGTTDQTLTSPTVTSGTFDAADPTFTAVPGGPDLEAVLHYKDTGTGSTSRAVFFQDGRIVVECNTTAAAAATSIPVLPLPAGLANGTVLTFSNGATATLSALAAAGARALTVSALAAQVTAGSYASADPSPASGLPVTPNGGNITIQFDSGANKIFTV